METVTIIAIPEKQVPVCGRKRTSYVNVNIPNGNWINAQTHARTHMSNATLISNVMLKATKQFHQQNCIVALLYLSTA